ncbi:MAG: exodeoxyribonuclease VII large subunit [Acidobacteriaceae bacterium]
MPDPQETVNQMGLAFPEAPVAKGRHVWKVGQLVGEVRNHIEREYAAVWVEGEISNLRPAPSGHIYFTLKDGDAQLPVVLFRKQAILLRFRLEDGLQVLVRGRVSVYEQRGQMQLVAELVEPVGAGSLQIAFEQLKTRLQQEGLFDAARKAPLPAFPHCIGIITSPSGAVIRDFLNIARRRHLGLYVQIYPAAVQGDSAALEIAAGLAFFNQSRAVDVVVLARGGGSLEDMAPFNSELLARAIANSRLPVVSAVGHETDFTIADFVADLRAPTPSAAAELLTEAQHKVEERLEQLHRRLTQACRFQLVRARERFARLSAPAAFGRMRNTLARRQQRVDELQYQLEGAWRRQNRWMAETLQKLEARLLRQDVSHRMRFVRDRLGGLDGRIDRAQKELLQRFGARHAHAHGLLQSLSPLAVLNRGYALVFDEAGALLRDASATNDGSLITTRFARSTLVSRVIERKPPQTSS